MTVEEHSRLNEKVIGLKNAQTNVDSVIDCLNALEEKHLIVPFSKNCKELEDNPDWTLLNSIYKSQFVIGRMLMQYSYELEENKLENCSDYVSPPRGAFAKRFAEKEADSMFREDIIDSMENDMEQDDDRHDDDMNEEMRRY